MVRIKQQILLFLDDIKESNNIIIVEGKNDKKALIELGISPRTIIRLDRPLFEIVEKVVGVNERRKSKGLDPIVVIILTDLDKKGKELYATINHDLQQYGVKVDNKFRNFLFKKTGLRQIEGFVGYMKGLD